MAIQKPTKVPMPTSFAWLCGFIGTLHTCLNVLAQGKLDVNAKVDFTIPVSGWGTDNTVPTHPNYIDITVPGLLATDIVAVDVAPASASVAETANFASTESYAGRFRLRAENVPTTAITAQYHITNTADYETSTDEETEE